MAISKTEMSECFGTTSSKGLKVFMNFSGPVVKTLRFHFRDTGSIPGQGTKILHAMWCG